MVLLTLSANVHYPRYPLHAISFSWFLFSFNTSIAQSYPSLRVFNELRKMPINERNKRNVPTFLFALAKSRARELRVT